MNRIARQAVTLSLTLMIALASVAMSAPKSERARKYFTIEGRVLNVNIADRTLLVSELWSKQLYLVRVPAGESFRITFGQNMRMGWPEIRDAHKGDRVRFRCTRTGDHLARLDDGREVVTLTTAP